MEFYFFVKFKWFKLDVVSNNRDNIVIIDENFLDFDLWIDYRD